MSLTNRLCQSKSTEIFFRHWRWYVQWRSTQFMSGIREDRGIVAGLALLTRCEGLPEEVFAGGFAVTLWQL